MTGDEWRSCAWPKEMLRPLVGRVSDRKLRLFGCACVHRIWHLLTDPRSQALVETVEGYADGGASADDLAAAIADHQPVTVERDDAMMAEAHEKGYSPNRVVRVNLEGLAEMAVQALAWVDG